MSLTVTLLGAPSVLRDGVPLTISTRKAVALLAYLAVTGAPHTRDALATLLWPEAGSQHARGALRYTLIQLRAAIGDEWLLVSREQIGLATRDDLSTDVAAFDALLQRIRAHEHALSEPCPTCAPLLREAVALHRSPLLSGFSLPDSPAFDDWLLFEGERLQRATAELLQALVAGYRASGTPGEAIPYAQRWLALDRFDDGANHVLLELLIASGQRGAAGRHYEAYTRLLHDELHAQPPAATSALIERLNAAAGEGERVRQPERVSLAHPEAPRPSTVRAAPRASSPLVGRAHELTALGRLLDDPACRLLTLLGPGGSGKTSLALAVAHTCAHRYTHGAAVVQLAGLSTPSALVATIAAAVGSPRETGGYTQQRLLAELRARQQLLVLDNLEHLLERASAQADTVATLLDAILAAAPGIQILLTSRVRAQLYQEQLYPVGGLDYPDRDDAPDAAHYGAVQLFVQRARRVDSAFRLTPATVSSVVRITRLLAGQPLAIELAAAWVTTLSPREIADELASGIDLLASDARNIPRRHRSMRACYTLSWERLQPAEQAAQEALSVFRGGFTREAAEQVAGASAHMLQALIDQSLLHAAPASDGRMRYGVHELLRQFAAEQLAHDPQREAQVRERHAAYYAALMELAMFDRPMDELWGMFECEQHNLISALSWMRDHNQIFAERVVRFWRARGYLAEGLTILEELVTRAAAPPTSVQAQAQMYYSAALVMGEQGDLTRAHAWLTESLQRYQALQDRLGVIRVLNLLGRTAFNQGDLAGATAQWQAVLQRAQERPDSVALATERAFALGNLGEAASQRGALEEAQQHYEAALTRARELKRTDLEAIQLGNLGTLARQRGAFARAHLLHGQALRIWQPMREDHRIASLIEQVAATRMTQGSPADGARFLGAATRLREELGVLPTHLEQREHDQVVQLGRNRLGLAAWTQAFAAGAALSTEAILDEVVALTRLDTEE